MDHHNAPLYGNYSAKVRPRNRNFSPQLFGKCHWLCDVLMLHHLQVTAELFTKMRLHYVSDISGDDFFLLIRQYSLKNKKIFVSTIIDHEYENGLDIYYVSRTVRILAIQPVCWRPGNVSTNCVFLYKWTFALVSAWHGKINFYTWTNLNVVSPLRFTASGFPNLFGSISMAAYTDGIS